MPQAVQHLRRNHNKVKYFQLQVNPNRGFLRQLDEYRK